MGAISFARFFAHEYYPLLVWEVRQDNLGPLKIFYGKLLLFTSQQGYHLLPNKYLVNHHWLYHKQVIGSRTSFVTDS